MEGSASRRLRLKPHWAAAKADAHASLAPRLPCNLGPWSHLLIFKVGRCKNYVGSPVQGVEETSLGVPCEGELPEGSRQIRMGRSASVGKDPGSNTHAPWLLCLQRAISGGR